MPTKTEREYYRMGFNDGLRQAAENGSKDVRTGRGFSYREGFSERDYPILGSPSKKRKLSAWNKFVKANSKKPRFILRSGKLNLKKMGVAFRKTPAGKKKRR